VPKNVVVASGVVFMKTGVDIVVDVDVSVAA